MNICHVNLARGFSGGERQTLELLKTQLAMGMDVLAVTHPDSPLTNSIEMLRVETVTARSFLDGHFVKALKKTNLILHAHDGRAVHWCAVHKLLFKTPFILTRRIDLPIRKNIATKWSYAKADYQVAISSAIKNILEVQNPSVPTCLIPSSPVSYPVDEAKVEQYQNQLGKDHFFVVHAAKMLSHKAFDITIQAALILSQTAPSVQILLLGDGPLEKDIRKQAASLPNVKFLGKQRDMGNWFKIADVLMLPSRTEGLGSVLLEAMLAGVPVIGTSVGGIPDIVKNELTGLLIPPNNPNALAQAILRLKSDEALRQQLIKEASSFVLGLSIEHSAEKYSSIYENILKKFNL